MKCVFPVALVLCAQGLLAQTIQIDSGYATAPYTASDGTTWQVDNDFVSGDGLYTGNPIKGTPDPALYQTARYGLYSNFGYQIPVVNGSYNLTLKFAEIRYSAAGQRVFNVTINGAPVLTNFDILAQTSTFTALDETFPVTVSSGLIDIEFVGVVNGGIVNAVQVKPATSPLSLSLSAPSSSVTSGQSLQFAASLTGGSSGAQTANVTWSASQGTISSAGLYVAPTVTANTNVTISAQTVSTPAIQSQMQITVLPATAAPVLSVAPGSLSFSGMVGSAVAPQTLNVGSSGTALTWSVTGAPAWLTLSVPTQTTPSVVTVTANPAGLAAGSYNAALVFSPVSVTGTPISIPVTLALAATPATGTSTFQIDSGFRTTSYTGADGTVWQTDAYFNGGDGLYTGNPIAGTTDPALYQTARYGLYSDFGYQFPVNNGTYYVTLKFAEILYSAAGQRVFNVTINGSPVLTNFDILAQTAAFTALDKTFPVTVTGNVIDIEFTGVVNRGIVNAIKVSGTPPSTEPATLSLSAPASTVIAGQTLQFSATETGGASTTPAVTWSATQGSVSSTGLFTAPTVSTSTSVVISAQTTSTPALSAQSTVTVTPAQAAPVSTPTLSVSPTGTLSFAGTTGSTVAAQTLAIQSSGSALSWSASGIPAWLTLSATSGTTPASITVTPNTSGLTATSYTASIVIANGSSSSLTVPVTLTLTAASSPALSVSPGSLSFLGTVGGTLATQVLNVTNTSGSALGWTASASPSWLSLSATSGSTPGTVTVTANPASLSVGSVNGSITFNAPGAAGSPFTVSVTVTLAASGGSQFYVSPTGTSSGNGSMAQPWDLQTALSGPASVTPGSTIYLLGGTYGDSTTEYSSYLAGTASAPITVMGYPGQRATVDGGISTYSPYVWYRDFEIYSSQTDRSQGALRQECIDTYAGSTGVKIINMVLHDCLQGIGFWSYAVGGEANGNLIYFNGETGTTRGVGHGIYTQNQCPETRTINDNIIFDSFDINFQGYGSGSAYVQCYSLDGNVSFDAGSPVGSYVDNMIFATAAGLDQINISDTYTYFPPGANDGYSRMGWVFNPTGNGTLTATNNYWIGGGGGEASIELWGWNNITYNNNTQYSTQGDMLMLEPGSDGTANYSFNNNQYYGSGLVSVAGNLGGVGQLQGLGLDKTATFSSGSPTGLWTFIRPNKYESGRANIIIYNWALSASVAVNLSTVLNPGDPYVIRDTQNYYGAPVASGTYTGAPISIPMVGNPKAVPVGYTPIASTEPQFGVFIVSHQ